MIQIDIAISTTLFFSTDLKSTNRMILHWLQARELDYRW